MRIAFFGTPDFAVPTLQGLLASPHDVVAVVTQPDRPRTRSHSTLLPPPVKVAALEAGLPVFQPDRPRGDTFLDQLRALRLDLGVVVAYGHLIPPPLLALPRLGLVNVHASLLPRWRGAAPIHWAIKSGDTETGVSIMRLEEGLDTGPTWRQERTAIRPTDTTGLLFDRLALIGREALLASLDAIAHGHPPVPQPSSGVTVAPKITRDMARVDWQASARTVSAQIRAMDPFPGAWTTHAGHDLKLGEVSVVEELSAGEAGSVRAEGGGIVVQCGSGTVRIGSVRPAGRREMPAGDWFRGVSSGAELPFR